MGQRWKREALKIWGTLKSFKEKELSCGRYDRQVLWTTWSFLSDAGYIGIIKGKPGS